MGNIDQQELIGYLNTKLKYLKDSVNKLPFISNFRRVGEYCFAIYFPLH